MKKGLRITTIAIIVLMGLFAIFTTCNKTIETFIDFNTESQYLALDQLFVSELFNEAIKISDETLKGSNSANRNKNNRWLY